MKCIKQKLRAQFQAEWTWRLFYVLAVAGFIGIVWLDLSDWRWSFLPSDFTTKTIWTDKAKTAREVATDKCLQQGDGYNIMGIYYRCDQFGVMEAKKYLWTVPFVPHSWRLFDSEYWELENEPYNWLFLALLFGPFAVAKSIDWIAAGRKAGEQ